MILVELKLIKIINKRANSIKYQIKLMKINTQKVF